MMEVMGIYDIAVEETYSDGQIIFKEGDSGDWIYDILDGSVEISKTIEGKNHTVALLQRGEVFGELAFIGGIKRTATARAVGCTTVGIIDRECLEKEINRLSSRFRTILVAVVQRFENMMERARAFSSRREDRVTKTLSLKFRDRRAFVKAYTDNFSAGGLFIKTEKPLESGKHFLLKLQLPDIAEPIKTKCEVVWVRKQTKQTQGRPAGMGVKFCEMSKKDNQILKGSIKEVM